MAKKKTKQQPKPKKAAAKSTDPHAGMTLLEGLIAEVEHLTHEFIDDFNVNTSMTGRERLRLFGAGVRNYGFLEKAYDIARENPQFNPPQFDVKQMGKNYREFEQIRQLSLLIQQFLQVVNDYMLISSDGLFRDALRIYGSLREQSRNRVPGATPLFQALLRFFRPRSRHPKGGEPTIHELEMDFKRLIHGKADGEIIIENERPIITAGKRNIVDNVRKGKAIIKESETEELK